MDKSKVYEMIACHDMIETISGDIPNHDNTPSEQKQKKAILENEAKIKLI